MKMVVVVVVVSKTVVVVLLVVKVMIAYKGGRKIIKRGKGVGRCVAMQ